MDTGRAGTIGGISADALLGLSFFHRQGLLPKTVIKQEIVDWPAADFSNLGAGSLTPLRSRTRIVSGGGNQNFGWNFGASYAKALIIVGGLHPCQSAGIGVMLNDAAPTDVTLTGKKAYINFLSTFSSQLQLYLDQANAFTLLGSEAEVRPAGANNQPSYALALYADGVADVVKAFIRIGSEIWWPFKEVSEATIATFAAAGVYVSSGANAMFAECPLGVYVE